MARMTIAEAKEEVTLNLDQAVLQVETKHDGYSDIALGSHEYLVVQTGDNYSVHPVRPDVSALGVTSFDKDKALLNDPIIRVEGTEVYFMSNTRIDPYNNVYPVKVDTADTVSDKLLEAFEAFVKQEFALGSYNIYFVGERGYEDGVVPDPEP